MACMDLNAHAAGLNLTFFQGEPTDYLFTLTDWEGKEPIDIRNGNIYGTVAGIRDTERWDIQVEPVPDSEDKVLTFPELKPGRYVWELWADWGDGNRNRLIAGAISVEASVQTWEEAATPPAGKRVLNVRISAGQEGTIKARILSSGFAAAMARSAAESAARAANSEQATAAAADGVQGIADAAKESAEAAAGSAKEAAASAQKAQEAEGKGSYELWKEHGHPEGTVDEFLESLKGAPGKDGIMTEEALNQIYARKDDVKKDIAATKEDAKTNVETAKTELKGLMASLKTNLEGQIGDKLIGNIKFGEVYETMEELPTAGMPQEGFEPGTICYVRNADEEGHGKAFIRTKSETWQDVHGDFSDMVRRAEFEEHTGNKSIHVNSEEKTQIKETAEKVKQLQDAVNFHNYGTSTVYEFVIDTNDENPFSRVLYPMGCANYGMAPAGMDFWHDVFMWGDWKDAFFMPRPVMLRFDGTEDYELNPDDYSLAKTMILSDVANPEYDGHAMMSWPQVWLRYEMDGRWMHVAIANKQAESGFNCFTHHNYEGKLVDRIYTMIYQPYKDTTVKGTSAEPLLRSLSGQTICLNNTGTNEILWAENNTQKADGKARWSLWDYGQWMMIQMLLTLMGKGTNHQAIYGRGRADGSGGVAKTGEADKKGLFYGTEANGMLKIFGMENFWGNYWKRMNGMCYSTTRGLMYKMTESMVDGTTQIGYARSGSDIDCNGYHYDIGTFGGSSGGYIKACTLNERGIFPKMTGAAEKTYWCDGLWWAGAGFAFVGGGCADGGLAGPFSAHLSDAVSHAYGGIGGSLSCKPNQ